jgi:hypothetical protein
MLVLGTPTNGMDYPQVTPALEFDHEDELAKCRSTVFCLTYPVTGYLLVSIGRDTTRQYECFDSPSGDYLQMSISVIPLQYVMTSLV